jgi:hypothetical protein
MGLRSILYPKADRLRPRSKLRSTQVALLPLRPSASPTPEDGRITIVAYALGEKSFLDTNGDNIYSAAEQFQDLGDIYVDRKYDGFFFQADDQFISVSLPEEIRGACADTTSDLMKNPGASIPSRPDTCSGKWGRAYVRRALQTVLSTSDARPLWGIERPAQAVGVAGVCPVGRSLIVEYKSNLAVSANFYPIAGTLLYGMSSAGFISFTAADSNAVAYNPLAAGTVVSASGTEGLDVSVVGGSPIPNTSAPTGVALNYKFDLLKANEGTITVSIKSPSGLTTDVSFFVSTKAFGADAKGTEVLPSTNPKTYTDTPDSIYRKSLVRCN